MSDPETDQPDDGAPPRKKGKKKLLVILGALVVLGGGAGGGLYAAGIVGGGGEHAGPVEDGKPKLVPKAEQKRIAAGEGGEGEAKASEGKVLPGADKYASNYYTFPKDFTSNLGDSDRFVQVGLAVSTPYDDTVIENIKTNEIAVRSAVLLALGDTTEDMIADEAGKKRLQQKLAAAINATLKEKEGFGGVGNVYFTNFVVQ